MPPSLNPELGSSLQISLRESQLLGVLDIIVQPSLEAYTNPTITLPDSDFGSWMVDSLRRSRHGLGGHNGCGDSMGSLSCEQDVPQHLPSTKDHTSNQSDVASFRSIRGGSILRGRCSGSLSRIPSASQMYSNNNVVIIVEVTGKAFEGPECAIILTHRVK